MKENKKKLLLIISGLLLILVTVFSFVSFTEAKPAAKPAKKTDAKKATTDPKTANLTYAADIISVKGNGLRLKRISSPHWLIGRINMPDYVKDLVETDKETVACLEFLNGSQLGINKGTIVEIISTSEIKDITRRGVVEKVILKSGTVWAKVTKSQSESFNIETQNGVLGVKGTEFVVEVDPTTKTEKVTILDGQVEFKPLSGVAQMLKPGDILSLVGKDAPKVMQQSLDEIRKNLDQQFPVLNPNMQSMIAAQFKGAMSMMNEEEMNKAAGEAQAMMGQMEESMKKFQEDLDKKSDSGFPNPFAKKKPKDDKKANKVADLSPNNATVDTYFPQFKWKKVDGAENYRVIITSRPIEKDEKNPGYYAYEQSKDDNWTYAGDARMLKPGTTYYWKVVPVNGEGKPAGEPSDNAKFTMADLKTLGFRGIFPSGNILTFEGDLVFDWVPLIGVKTYKVEVSEAEDLSNPVFSGTAATNYIVMAGASKKLSRDKDYYWRVTPMEKVAGAEDMKPVTIKFAVKAPK